MTVDKGDPATVTVDPPDQLTDESGAETCETPAVQSDVKTPISRGELPLDVVFDVLKNRRRRLVLRYLHQISERTTLSDLSEHIAAIENDKHESELTSSERKRVYVCLYQCHLPKMDDAGVLEFVSDRGTVVLADETDEFTRYLDLDATDQRRDWPRYYLALSAVGGVVFVGQRLLFASDVLSGIIMGVLVGLFVNLALEHARSRDTLPPLRIARLLRAKPN